MNRRKTSVPRLLLRGGLAIAGAALAAAALAAPLQLSQHPHRCTPEPTLDERPEDTAPTGPPVRVSIASSTSRVRTDGHIFVAGFDPRRWSGEVTAHRIAAGSHTVDETPSWRASTWLDSPLQEPAQRRIYTHDGTAAVAFEWARLSGPQKALLRDGDSARIGRQRVDYLRGNRFLETQYGGAMRQRDSRLGAIVNANLWHLAHPTRMAFEHAGHADFRRRMADRTPMVYAGANDGMLHGFDAETGAERLAYLPQAAYAGLAAYTRPDRVQRYLFDGHPFTGDADLRAPGVNLPDWRTVLVSGLAGGGRGYVVLDVTDPAAFSAGSVLLDRSFAADAAGAFAGHEDVGHLYAEPVVDGVNAHRSEQVVKLNNGRWAVVLGNGVNSAHERPVLLIQYLDGDRRLLRLVAQAALHRSNGLSAPRLIDLDGNGTMDVAYAGDLHGQLWKFLLTSPWDAEWGVSAWDGGGGTCPSGQDCTPFFVAMGPDDARVRQPITAAPLWLAHPLGGIQLLLGTGQRLQDADASDTRTQSIYGLWDNSRILRGDDGLEVVDTQPITPELGRHVLVRQSVVGRVTRTDPATGLLDDTALSRSTDHTVVYSRGDPTTRRGWYMDLPEAGERVLRAPRYFEGQKAIVESTAPAVPRESCDAAGQAEAHWLTVLNMISGRPSATPVFAFTDATTDLRLATRLRVSGPEHIGLPDPGRGLELISVRNGAGCTDRLCTDSVRLQGSAGGGLRADWREVRR